MNLRPELQNMFSPMCGTDGDLYEVKT